MTLHRLAPAILACAALTACGSATSSTSTSTPPPASTASSAVSPATAAAVVPMPTSSPTGAQTCANFDEEAAHLVTYAHYASLNVGTNNDTLPTFGDMNEAMGVLTVMAPECAPTAAEAIAALGVAAGAAAATYLPGDDPTVTAANKATLESLKAAGVTAWEAMGKDPAPWDSALRFVD